MEERQITVDGVSHPLPRPFLVISTQNPIDSEGTYALPEAQLDRFLLRVSLGYPSPADEEELVRRRLIAGSDHIELRPILDAASLGALQRGVEAVHVGADVVAYAVALVGATRHDEAVEVGSSPRGTLALVKTARALAALAGRAFVQPDDLKAIAVPALAHRLVLKPDAWIRGVSGRAVIERCLTKVPTPAPLSEADRQRLSL